MQRNREPAVAGDQVILVTAPKSTPLTKFAKLHLKR